MRYDWDDEKNEQNKQKHGVWFEEAIQIFDDPSALLFKDIDHSEVEERFIMLGSTPFGRILVAIHCVRENGDVIRIISARKATYKEIKVYEEGI
jgi:uncharacterized DUF497 family protein